MQSPEGRNSANWRSTRAPENSGRIEERGEKGTFRSPPSKTPLKTPFWAALPETMGFVGRKSGFCSRALVSGPWRY